MKKMLSFIRKEFYHIFRDKRTMLILIGMPMVQIILFGFAISNDVKNVRVAYYAPHYNNDIQKLVAKIDANDYFIVVGKCTTKEDINHALLSGKADIVAYFDRDFSKIGKKGSTPTVNLIIDACDPNMATMESTILTQVINDYFKNPAGGTGALLVPHTRLLYNPSMESSYNFVPGIMGLILMVICAMMTSISIVREKEVGTMEVLLVSPSRPMGIIFAKMVPYFTISCLNLATILVLSVFVLKLPIAGSLIGLILFAMLYIALALAFGLLISTIMKTQVSAMLVSMMGLLMPTMLLSGMIYPVENMPAILQWISAVIPARWFISAVRKVMIQGLPMAAIVKEIAVIGGMLIIITGLSLKNFKKRLE